MQQRGDLILNVIDLFRTKDIELRSRIAAKIADIAKSSAELEPTAHPAQSLRPADEKFLANRTMVLDHLDDAALDTFNSLLPWGAMTADSAGRTVGAAWNETKRSKLNPLIDDRITSFDEIFPLKNLHVLEVGCFEGIHTIGCLAKGAKVTAVDVRIENILKTLARLWIYGLSADVQYWNLEAGEPPASVPSSWDVLHHIGVLYHLADPATHLALALDRTKKALILDTHVSSEVEETDHRYHACGRTFAYTEKEEKPISPFAGVKDHAKWLKIEDLEWICRNRGFTDVRIIDVRQERNGERVLLWAFRD